MFPDTDATPRSRHTTQPDNSKHDIIVPELTPYCVMNAQYKITSQGHEYSLTAPTLTPYRARPIQDHQRNNVERNTS